MSIMRKLGRTSRIALAFAVVLGLGTVGAYIYFLLNLAPVVVPEIVCEIEPEALVATVKHPLPSEEGSCVIDTKADPEARIKLVFINKAGKTLCFHRFHPWQFWTGTYVYISRLDPNLGMVDISGPQGDIMIGNPTSGVCQLQIGERDTVEFSLAKRAFEKLVTGKYQLYVLYHSRGLTEPITPIVFEKKFWITIK